MSSDTHSSSRTRTTPSKVMKSPKKRESLRARTRIHGALSMAQEIDQIRQEVEFDEGAFISQPTSKTHISPSKLDEDDFGILSQINLLESVLSPAIGSEGTIMKGLKRDLEEAAIAQALQSRKESITSDSIHNSILSPHSSTKYLPPPTLSNDADKSRKVADSLPSKPARRSPSPSLFLCVPPSATSRRAEPCTSNGLSLADSDDCLSSPHSSMDSSSSNSSVSSNPSPCNWADSRQGPVMSPSEGTIHKPCPPRLPGHSPSPSPATLNARRFLQPKPPPPKIDGENGFLRGRKAPGVCVTPQPEDE